MVSSWAAPSRRRYSMRLTSHLLEKAQGEANGDGGAPHHAVASRTSFEDELLAEASKCAAAAVTAAVVAAADCSGSSGESGGDDSVCDAAAAAASAASLTHQSPTSSPSSGNATFSCRLCARPVR